MSATPIPPGRREATIDELRKIRSSAIRDIAGAAPALVDSQWMTDRIKDVEYCNRQLKAMGVE